MNTLLDETEIRDDSHLDFPLPFRVHVADSFAMMKWRPRGKSKTMPGVTAVIVGLGTDIVEIVRIGKMIERHGELFLTRVYTPEEIRYCQKRKECYQHFAGRWAAKEAVMKTLGTGFTRGVSWQDIEVCALKSGKPKLKIRGGARDHAERLGIDEILITISHCRAYATATAIAVQQNGQEWADAGEEPEEG